VPLTSPPIHDTILLAREGGQGRQAVPGAGPGGRHGEPPVPSRRWRRRLVDGVRSAVLVAQAFSCVRANGVRSVNTRRPGVQLRRAHYAQVACACVAVWVLGRCAWALSSRLVTSTG
jgi:hypothetical protein